MESRAHALAAGMFILLLGIAAAAAAWWLSDQAAATSDYVLVAKRSVTGLNNEAQVRYRGIRSGKVLDIALDPQDPRQILVTIRIDADVPVTAATTAQLNYQGVTGLAYVGLEDSGEQRELMRPKDGVLPRIPLEPSQIEVLGDAAVEVAGKAATLITRVNALLDDDSIAHIRGTLANLERLTARADVAMKELPVVVGQLQRLLSDDNAQSLRSILANLDRTSAESAPLARDARALVADLAALSKRMDALTSAAGAEVVGNTLPRAGVLLDELTTNSRQLKRVLNELENAPQALLFGKGRPQPGPGEDGYAGAKP